MGREIVKGSTDQTVYFHLRKSANGTDQTGLVYNSAGAICYYTRNGATAAVITLATLAAADSAHSDGGFKEVHATNSPGLYRLDLPDAVVASGVDSVVVEIGFDDTFSESLEISLIDNTKKEIYDIVNHGTYGNAQLARSSALTTHDGKLDTAQSDLDTLTGTDGATLATSQTNYAPSKAGDLMGLSNDAITSAKYDESTAFPVKSDDSGTTQIARVGADGDTLETLSDQIDLSALATVCTEGRLSELDAENLPSDIDDILDDTGTNGVVVAVASKTGYALSTAGIKAIWDQLTSALTTVGSIGKKLTDWVLGSDNKVILSSDAHTGAVIPNVTLVGTTTTNTDMRGTDNAATASALSTHDGKLDTAQADLDTLTGTDGATLATSQPNFTPAVAGDQMNLANDAITASKHDQTTSHPVALADSGSNALARTGADGDTLETLSDEVAAVASEVTLIKASTDNLPPGVKKNTAFNNFEFLMVDSTDNKTGKTGLTVSGQRSIDGGAFSATTNAVTEVALGMYKINLSAADLNGDTIAFVFTASGANARELVILTNT